METRDIKSIIGNDHAQVSRRNRRISIYVFVFRRKTRARLSVDIRARVLAHLESNGVDARSGALLSHVLRGASKNRHESTDIFLCDAAGMPVASNTSQMKTLTTTVAIFLSLFLSAAPTHAILRLEYIRAVRAFCPENFKGCTAAPSYDTDGSYQGCWTCFDGYPHYSPGPGISEEGCRSECDEYDSPE